MALTKVELLERDRHNAKLESAQWREHYIGLYRSHAADNKKLIDTYGIEGEADCWDIIVRQDAALCNMRDRNENLRHQLDDYDQLNAAFENLRMERDELAKRLDEQDKQLGVEYDKVNRLFDEYSKALLERDNFDQALTEACEDLVRADDRIADLLDDIECLEIRLDDNLDDDDDGDDCTCRGTQCGDCI